jgi:4-hydroxythreonine-4-phosphate dehydrogenase
LFSPNLKSLSVCSGHVGTTGEFFIAGLEVGEPIDNETMQIRLESTQRSRLAITLGDPAGIGPEVVLKALADSTMTAQAEITVFGDRATLDRTYAHLEKIQGSPWAKRHLIHPDTLSVFNGQVSDAWNLGCPSAETGAASFSWLQDAITHTLHGDYDGIVTGPIAKSAWKLAGHLYPGQTELLAEKAGASRFGMMFVATSPVTQWQLRALLATTHIPLRQVPDALSPELLSLKLDLLVETLRNWFGIQRPRIAIAGLNPHSGEQGQLGTEEVEWLTPWAKAMGDRYPQIALDGPIPPDTLWVRPGQAWFGSTSVQTYPPHDAYLALYHDQGLIPVKLMAFDRAVNTTIGLPFIRTSPDHGTAFDIAGQGIADATSMKAAIALAQSLTAQSSSFALQA